MKRVEREPSFVDVVAEVVAMVTASGDGESVKQIILAFNSKCVTGTTKLNKRRHFHCLSNTK